MSKIIAVAGGKGGVGKTIIAVNVALLLSKIGKTIIIDADADNPCVRNTVKSLNVNVVKIEEIFRFKPRIIQEKCDLCKKCVEVCPEHALVHIPEPINKIMLIDTLCAGCSCCKLVCDRDAILEDKVVEGYVRICKIDNIDLIEGELKPGEKRSYIVMTKILEDYRNLYKKYDYAIIDAPPGTGAGVYSILKNSNIHIIVTEATKLGFNDFMKIMKLIQEKVKSDRLIVVINKYNLNIEISNQIEEYSRKFTEFIVKIPYSDNIARYYMIGKPVVLDNVLEKRYFEQIVKYIT